MKFKIVSRAVTILVTAAFLVSLFSTPAGAAPTVAPSLPVSFTILHTNDFHGQLEPSGSNPGSARVSNFVNSVRTALGDANVLLVDAGDEMQGSLLSNLGDATPTGKGMPTIAVYNAMSYDVATFGNHEFDWGQINLANRTTEANYPYVTANIVQNDTGNCATAGWTPPAFADAPYQILEAGVAPNTVKVAFIGVTTTEVPTITVATATEGLCFKDPTASVLHYYDAIKAAGADVIVVLSHLGFTDGGYGYGLPVTGDQTLAKNLNDAGKPVNLIIGGHSHTDVGGPAPAPAVATVGTTKIVQAHYNGRKVGRADITVGTDGSVSVAWTRNVINTTDPQDPAIVTEINKYALDPDYLTLVNTPVGYSSVDLPRLNGTVDNMMGTFIDDAIYNYLNTDAEPTNDIDIFFNNSGGIRTDWCWNGMDWINTGCVAGTHASGLLTYGDMFTILPFGNATVVGKMTGARILEVLHYGPNTAGVIQPAGLKYSYFKYTDGNPGPQPYAWGAYDVTVYNRANQTWEPLDLKKTYSVGTNEFLAPAGGDGYGGFKYMTNITYWGDMLNAVNAYVAATYGTPETSYLGPDGDGTLDDRILRDGNGDNTYEAGEIVPLTVLHHNDSHGNLTKGTYVGYTQLATLIKQEKLHNPDRTLLLSSGDNIQGDAMMYYFKSAPLGYAADGTPLSAALTTHPMMAVMNAMGYDAWTLGNHEFNFGKEIFTSVIAQATFPTLQANVADDGQYGLDPLVDPYSEKTIGPENIKVAILGIGNHRVPNYELPSNIPGLTFSDPIARTQELSTLLRPTNDVLIALTHIGFTENPASVEVDANVDTNLVALTTGIDAVIGGHSHTNPATGFGTYKYLPTIIADAAGNPVIVNHAYRYNNTLGEVSIGLRAKSGGGYEVVSQAGRYLSVASSTAEDSAIKSIVDPYVAQLNTYNNKVIGTSTVPIDTLQAFTQETNGANLQADASVWELKQHGITPDFHLSGAMTNKVINAGSLKISDMFAGMPYENSLVVMEMNGPQLKAVLERAYRNYYYYKYVSGYGGYSYYTTCMLDTNAGNQITYNDLYPALPNGNNVISLMVNGIEVNFEDASTYYKVSTVNYLAAGSCNFNNSGVSLWPLNRIVADTQYYVRDAVIDYITAQGTVSPAIEGRLNFIADTAGPVITINVPAASDYLHPASLTIDFTAADDISGLKTVEALLDGVTVTNAQVIDLYTLALGPHTFTVNALDKAGNAASQSVDFNVTATIDSLKTGVNRFYQDGSIKNKGVYNGLMQTLKVASESKKPELTSLTLHAFILQVKAQRGRHITTQAADLLIADANWVITHLADAIPPYIQIIAPRAVSYPRSESLRIDFEALDTITGVKEVLATLDAVPVMDNQKIDLRTLTLGEHVFLVTAVDHAGNTATKSVTFQVVVTVKSLKSSLESFYREGQIDSQSVYRDLMKKLDEAERSRKPSQVISALNSFIQKVQQQSGNHITVEAADQLIAEAQWLIDHTK
jgi:2',3'-cyclic-nucleotide 2'-phosphodiesterase/3'-nucleotidase